MKLPLIILAMVLAALSFQWPPLNKVAVIVLGIAEIVH
jgi:tellurite resistance protein TehA-like permease